MGRIPSSFEGEYKLNKDRLEKEVLKYCLGDTTKSKEFLDWKAKTTLDDGMEKCVEYAKNRLMKTAVCIAGYFDSFTDPNSKGVDGYKHLQKHVFSKCDTDVYMHSWDFEKKQFVLDLYGESVKGYCFEPQIDFSSIETVQQVGGYVPQSRLFLNIILCKNLLSYLNKQVKNMIVLSKHGLTLEG